jgi:SAM-dependent MidA family methyltransferase
MLCAQTDEKREHVEVCAEAGVVLEHLAVRLEEDGGLALFADYGHDGTKTDTFRVRFTTCSEALNYFSYSVSLWDFKYI